MTASDDPGALLLRGLTDEQRSAVSSSARRLLLIAGAGSGKTEVMARRVAWWIAVEGVPKDRIVAFTFTEKAAEEMKFRIRKWVGEITPSGEDATLSGMYVGTIHGFCLQMLQELAPHDYGVFDVLDETGRLALVQRGFHSPLALGALQSALPPGPSGMPIGQFETMRRFLLGYDLLNEHALLEVEGIDGPRPAIGPGERDWIRAAELVTDVGQDSISQAFAVSAARYYANLQARRLVDFSTAQAELVKLIQRSSEAQQAIRERFSHVVVDEFQDVNPVQERLVRSLVGDSGRLTAVGDHRQAIYGFRGGRVEIMAAWHAELSEAADGEIIELPHNFRAVPRLIDLANRWAETISPLGTMGTPPMAHGKASRLDQDESHVAIRHFDNRADEAAFIAEAIHVLVNNAQGVGAAHDVDDDRRRGLGLADIAILVRSSTDVRTYMDLLEESGIPSVVRAGPDLFQRPEVLVMVSALAIAAGVDSFLPGRPPTMASIASDVLGCAPTPEGVLVAAGQELRDSGLPVDNDAISRLRDAAGLIRERVEGRNVDRRRIRRVRTEPLQRWLRQTNQLRRVFPQTLYQWLSAEFGIAAWDADQSWRAQAAMFHLGQLSGLLTGIETPGWVTPEDLKWQIVALLNWGPRSARADEAPLLVPPDAATILTVHSAKGLEFPAVFLADVTAGRFPSQRARTQESMPFDGPALAIVNPAALADNANNDAERRLMYVAITRAERFLFISASGPRRSSFKRQLERLVPDAGGQVDPTGLPHIAEYLTSQSSPTFRLVTSFSDLRYYLECPHDYYLRKVLGFAPTIDQAFGYGRGIHNLMRAIHLDPAYFADLAQSPEDLRREVGRMIDEGLFYLRYTTGSPLENMQAKAMDVVADYVAHFRDELGTLEFEPERAFETLIEEAGILVSGAVDVIRHDDPPHVTLIDFKSGDPDRSNENASALDQELMQLQVSVYGLAAKTELEYEPDLGLVRYLGAEPGSSTEDRQLEVPLTDGAIAAARETVVDIARSIQDRHWAEGPRRGPSRPGNTIRCQECDFVHLCGRPEARS